MLRKMAKSFWLLLLGLLIAHPTFGQVVKEVNQTIPLNPDGQVAIQTHKGSITLTTWDQAAVEIYARIEPDGEGPDEQAKVRDTEVQIEGSGNSVSIRSDYRKLQDRTSGIWDFNGSLPLIHYTIKMPQTAKLAIKDHKSKISVAGVRSDVTVQTHKGTADISQLDGSLRVKTHKGDIRVQFANLTKESWLETHKGDIEIAVPKNRGFDLDSNVGRSGRLDTDFGVNLAGHRRNKDAKAYQHSINGGGPRLHLKTYKGSLRVRQI